LLIRTVLIALVGIASLIGFAVALTRADSVSSLAEPMLPTAGFTSPRRSCGCGWQKGNGRAWRAAVAVLGALIIIGMAPKVVPWRRRTLSIPQTMPRRANGSAFRDDLRPARGSCRREPCERDAGRWSFCADCLTVFDDYGKAVNGLALGSPWRLGPARVHWACFDDFGWKIFAGRYPGHVAGMILLDGQPAEAFEGLPSYPAFYNRFRRISALLPSLARIGVGRLVFHSGFASLPGRARDMQRLHYSSARHYRSLPDECAELPTSLAQARSFQGFGDRPLVVVTAARDAQAGWLPLQAEMATLSTNSSHRVVPYNSWRAHHWSDRRTNLKSGDPRRCPCGAIR
jgi:hypothetical protein